MAAHVMCCPLILIVQYALVWVIFWASGDDGEGPPGLGLLIIPHLVITALTLVAYYLAVAVRVIKSGLI